MEKEDVCYNCIEGKCGNFHVDCDNKCSLCPKHECNKDFPKCPKKE